MVATKTRAQPTSLTLVQQFRATMTAMNALPNAKKNNKSIQWFKETIKNIPRVKPSDPQVGRMYAFVYDAKYKKELPYWDRFPLIIALRVDKEYILGINLHYIAPVMRQQFLERLLAAQPRLLNQKSIGPKAKFNINWDAVKRYPGADKMIKLYIRNRLKSPTMEINAVAWANTVWLPTQQFLDKDGKRYSARKVWADGKRH
jgi:hypothetical protein